MRAPGGTACTFPLPRRIDWPGVMVMYQKIRWRQPVMLLLVTGLFWLLLDAAEVRTALASNPSCRLQRPQRTAGRTLSQ